METAVGLPPEVKVVFCRVTHESLINITKHLEAKQVTLRLTCRPAEIDIQIRDDGKGFNQAVIPADPLDLGIMNERVESVGARLEITIQIGAGETVCLSWVGERSKGSFSL